MQARMCHKCSSDITEEFQDAEYCSTCWEKLIEDINSNVYPCSDHSCIFTHPGGMGTNGGCHCMETFPIPRKIRRLLEREIRISNVRAKQNGKKEVLRWFERAINDKIWRDGESNGTIEKQLKYILNKMRFEL